ncbi:MAG: response regulator [Labilithrix sp.]|nr:response regulator [Labilithrix sp.]
MIRGRVLVIDGDEWVASALVRALQEKGYVVDASGEAVAGFRKASETTPDCIVLSPELPDIDGAWVARKVRTEAGALSKVPILFVGDLSEDRSARARTLNVGADVFLDRPISNDEIVAQIGALIAMARRLDGRDAEGSPSSTSVAAAIRGDLSAFPLASLLMMFEMERRSGLVEVVATSGKRASLTLTDGLFASTEIAGAPRPALEVLREVLAWRAGRFSFQPRESRSLPAPRASVGALVLEAMRLEDEEKSPLQEIGPDDLVDAVDSATNGRREEPATQGDEPVARPDLAPPSHPKAS